MLLSVGASTDHLEKIGQGPTLADQAALKPIQQHADERVVAISYVSKAFMQSLGSPQKTIDDIAGGIEEAMVQAKVDEEDRKTILDDVRALDVSKFMPAAGRNERDRISDGSRLRGVSIHDRATADDGQLEAAVDS